MPNIVILASGNGTNAEAIIRHFASRPDKGRVVGVITNNPRAGVIERARRLGVPCKYLPPAQCRDGQALTQALKDMRADIVILAGYMLLVPKETVQAFPRRIINLHPALLPLHGGKGMYGHHVHEAVIADHDPVTGITIHLVDEHYDRGTNLFKASFDIRPDDTPATIEERVHVLEHRHYPAVIEQYIADAHL